MSLQQFGLVGISPLMFVAKDFFQTCFGRDVFSKKCSTECLFQKMVENVSA